MSITAKKAQQIMRSKALQPMIIDPVISQGGSMLQSKHYWLLPCDLRQWQSQIVPLLKQGLDPNAPTLFLSECCLVYLDPTIADDIITSCSTLTQQGIFITYEPILPEDAFGRTMLDNLKSRGLALPGIHAYPTLETQQQRYLSNGWNHCEAIDFNQVWERLSTSEQERIIKLEWLDEVEEWTMLSSHYCITVAKK